MKNFDDFRSALGSSEVAQISDEIISSLREKLHREDYDDPVDFNLVLNRSYNVQMTMKLLEKYHKWLND